MNELQTEVGYVISCEDYLLNLEGLPSARINDLLVSDSGGRALVSSLESDRIQALMLDTARPKPGDRFRLNLDGIRIPLGDYLFGRTINPLGRPVDGRSALPLDGPKLDLDVTASGIGTREMITEQLTTGFTLVDTLLPLGKGQRELIAGDARSGKTSFLLDTILAQKGRNLICIYAAIGKPEIDTKRFAGVIEHAGAADYTIIVAATSSQSAPLIATAPYTAFFVAEHFLHQGREVLLILDDLGTHAKYLREMALLAAQIPGRESYPGGIFYEHAHLMERAGRFTPYQNASLTLLPVIETELDNMTGLIPTNLMSQTDGHLLFTAAKHSQGGYPAIDWARSVTRVGRQTQTLLQKTLSAKVRNALADYEELKGFIKFETELTEETQTKIKRAQLLEEFLRQESQEPVSLSGQLFFLTLPFTQFLLKYDLNFVKDHKRQIRAAVERNPKLMSLLNEPGLTDWEPFLARVEAESGTIEAACK